MPASVLARDTVTSSSTSHTTGTKRKRSPFPSNASSPVKTRLAPKPPIFATDPQYGQVKPTDVSHAVHTDEAQDASMDGQLISARSAWHFSPEYGDGSDLMFARYTDSAYFDDNNGEDIALMPGSAMDLPDESTSGVHSTNSLHQPNNPRPQAPLFRPPTPPAPYDEGVIDRFARGTASVAEVM